MRIQVDRRLVYHFDGFSLLLMLAIVGLGVATIYSATYQPDAPAQSPLAWRQAIWATAGLVAAFAMASFDYRRLERWAPALWLAGVVLLAVVPWVGHVGNGSRRWLALGPINFQPSELMKLALIAALARSFHGNAPAGGLRLRQLLVPTLLTGVPVALVMAQPDLGTAGIFVCILASMLFLAGLNRRTLASLAATGLAALPLLPWAYERLAEYQKRRIGIFLHPERDPLGAGYHVIQSKIAIGSGGVHGRGFLHGTQNQLHFLPEQHTDFIFSVFAEEWGFVGALVLLTLYALLLLRGLVVVNRAKERFGALLVFGVLANVFWQVAINLGMTTGLLPVVGIPLPLFSYGGSSLVTLMASLGLVLNVNMRRFARDRLPAA